MLVLIPLAILFLAVMEAYGLLEDMSDIAELQLPFPAVVNILVFFALGALAVFAACTSMCAAT